METPAKWISTSKRLLNESETLERKQHGLLAATQDPEVPRDLKNLNRERSAYSENVRKKIDYFQGLLLKIQARLSDSSSRPQNNTTVAFTVDRHNRDALQALLETFESRLSAFKLTMRAEFDHLEIYEQELSAQVAQVDELVAEIQTEQVTELDAIDEEYHHKEKEKVEQERKAKVEQDVKHKAAVGEIDRELAKLGRYGQWEVRDHDVFLRVWNAVFTGVRLTEDDTNNNDHDVDTALSANFAVQLTGPQRAALMRRLRTDVFAKTAEELEAHIDWYCRYLELTTRKKHLLSVWRQVAAQRQRREQNEKAVATVTEETGEGVELDALLDELAPSAGEDERARELRLQAKQRLTRWKQEKQQKEEEAKRRKMEEESKQKQQAALERKRRQSELHMALASWKQDEHRREAERSPSPVQDRPKSADSAALRRRQQQDLEKARTRKQQAEEVQAKRTERERRLSELITPSPEVPRDPARLLTMTKAAEAAKLTEVDLDAAQQRRTSLGAHLANVAMSGRDLRFIGRATPMWMRPPAAS